MKNVTYIFIVLIFSIFTACVDENYEFGEIIIPSDINFTVDIVGADTVNPYGDGTGEVIFSSTAKNALSFKYAINGVEYISPSGKLEHLFTKSGLQEYTVNIIAIGTAGIQSSLVSTVEVLVLYEPPVELLTMLTLNSKRTWRIKNEVKAHFGLGPPFGDDPFEWYDASANEKSYTGMYDDRFVFNIDGTFKHLTGGTVFAFEEYINNDIGSSGIDANERGEIDHYPLEDYSENWTLSAPGGQETLSLSGTGFISFYVGGNHKYRILTRSDNEMTLSTTEGDEEFEWGFVLVAID
jgi:hypothetical protein